MNIERVATMPRNIWRSITREHLNVLKVLTPGRVEGMTKRAYSSRLQLRNDTISKEDQITGLEERMIYLS